MNAAQMIAALEAGAEANYADPCRDGNVVRLPAEGVVFISGDLHGSRANFRRLLIAADLENHPDHHLVVHELIHSSTPPTSQVCHSYELVALAARTKSRYPGQFHYLIGNHAIAQATGEEVLKNDQPMVRSLDAGLNETFQEDAEAVREALGDLVVSMPVAVRTANRVWVSHSLPSGRNLPNFSSDIFAKRLTIEDLREDPSLRALTWDRGIKQSDLDELRDILDADLFVVGHEPQESGRAQPLDRLIILASDHVHGCYLRFDLGRTYEPADFYACVRPLAEVDLGEPG